MDFKDLTFAPSLRDVEFHCGLFYDAQLEDERFDLVTMWHFLEHDYDPLRSLETAARVLKPEGRLVVEVPRLDSRTFRWFGDRWPGLQAPQHTVLFDRDSLLRAVRREVRPRGGRLPSLRRVPPPTSISLRVRPSA